MVRSKGTVKQTVLAHTLASGMALVALLAAPAVVESVSWLASDALNAPGGIASVSLGGGMVVVAAIVVGVLAVVGGWSSLIRWLVRGVVLRVVALVLTAPIAGAAAAWYLRQEIHPWPGPIALGLAVGAEVLLLTIAYSVGLGVGSYLLETRVEPGGR